MASRDIGQEILDGIREIKDFKKNGGNLRTHVRSEPSAPDVIREKMHLSQIAFAGLIGVSVKTLQDWEQGRRKPSGSALLLASVVNDDKCLE
jgi:putative transcriptional regulator